MSSFCVISEEQISINFQYMYCESQCLLKTALATPTLKYTRKNAQVVTSLQTSCHKSVHK